LTIRLNNLSRSFLACLFLLSASYCAAADAVAERIAHAAKEAEDNDQVVRAYMLYSAACVRDPHNQTYCANRDALAPAAKLLTKADIESADISRELTDIEKEAGKPEPPIEMAKRSDWERDETLQPIPKLQPVQTTGTFDIRGDEKSLYEGVAKVFGLKPVFDPGLEMHPNLHFDISEVDFRTSMEALTAATDTFMFPISNREFYVARDTEQKRNELEPEVLLTFPLPSALEQKDLIEAANVARTSLNLRTIGYDSTSRIVMVRDRYTRANVARELLQALLLPKGQISFEVEFLTFDSDKSYHYGLSLPTSMSVATVGNIAHFQTGIPSALTGTFFIVGGGPLALGLDVAQSASLFATYSESHSQALYDATVVVMDGQTANLHIGDKYPIPTTIFTGTTSSNSSSIYNPIGQVTLEDLGIILKLTPRLNGDGEISLGLEASYKSLGATVIDTVPSIAQREFKGTVTMKEGEWAIVAGLNAKSQMQTRTGIAGLSNVKGLNQVLSENNRETIVSDTLLVIKPTITRLPRSAAMSPQYYIGSAHGERVLL
jgi:general secretion pathway protein D